MTLRSYVSGAVLRQVVSCEACDWPARLLSRMRPAFLVVPRLPCHVRPSALFTFQWFGSIFSPRNACKCDGAIGGIRASSTLYRGLCTSSKAHEMISPDRKLHQEFYTGFMTTIMQCISRLNRSLFPLPLHSTPLTPMHLYLHPPLSSCQPQRKQPQNTLVDTVLVTVFSVLHNFDPIVIRIEQESNILHSAISKTLLPVAAKLLKAFASSGKLVNGNTWFS